MKSPIRSTIIISLTLIVAISLAVWPLPDWAKAYRPDWLALVLAYWVMALPQKVGVGTAWFVGLLLDVLSGTLLGVHALGLSLVAWAMMRLHLQMRVYPLIQQSILIFVLLLLRSAITAWLAVLSGAAPMAPILILGPAISGAVLWPWLFILLRDIRRRARVQ